MRSPLAIALLLSSLACSRASGVLELGIVTSGQATPARVELIDDTGKAWIPNDALPVALECIFAPPPEWLRPRIESREFFNPYTDTTQFYLAGHTRIELPAGRYQLRVFKGNEYRVAKRQIDVAAGERVRLEVELERWTDPAARGWVSSDDHVHISRARADANPGVATWMGAEGLRVANLLQMGTADQLTAIPQYAFGDAGVYNDGETTLITGQEHPRTHFLGHTITLGAREAIDLRDRYIVFEEFWKASEQKGGVSGFAHFGQGPANDGLAISAPGGRIHFVEVLQFEFPRYKVWYELLNLGFRIAPSAGTDFPCIPSTPGRERVYVGLDGPLTRERYVDGVRKGRTFVTNGPVLELEVEGAGIGSEIALSAPASLRVRGSVRFDPERDDVKMLELLSAGDVVRVETERIGPGEIALDARIEVDTTTWLALRASGSKLDEAPIAVVEIPSWAQGTMDRFASGWSMEGRDEFIRTTSLRPSAAHTAAVFVTVAGTSLPHAPRVAREWIARLDALEARLADEHIAEIAIWDRMPYSDGVSEEHLRRNRPALLEDISEAREHFRAIANREPVQ